jgi:hypothetical protein
MPFNGQRTSKHTKPSTDSESPFFSRDFLIGLKSNGQKPLRAKSGLLGLRGEAICASKADVRIYDTEFISNDAGSVRG